MLLEQLTSTQLDFLAEKQCLRCCSVTDVSFYCNSKASPYPTQHFLCIPQYCTMPGTVFIELWDVCKPPVTYCVSMLFLTDWLMMTRDNKSKIRHYDWRQRERDDDHFFCGSCVTIFVFATLYLLNCYINCCRVLVFWTSRTISCWVMLWILPTLCAASCLERASVDLLTSKDL